MNVYEDIKTGLEQAIAYEKENNSKKAILVIDMPETCDECILLQEHLSCLYCRAGHQRILTEYRPDWCPLKPVPKKIDIAAFDNSIKAGADHELELGAYMYDRGIYRGYNICIDKIVGE